MHRHIHLNYKLYLKYKHNLMLNWPETILNIDNQDDHEQQCDDTKQIEGIMISSTGRYTITLSRINKESISNQAILEQIEEQYGIEKEQFQITNYKFQAANAAPSNDLIHIFTASKIALSGNVDSFKHNHNIQYIEQMRKIVDDGNTIIIHFWDNQYHYVLMHEIKYHH